MKRFVVPLGAALILVLAACGGDDDGDASGGDCSAGQTDGDLAFYNWTEYMDPELITQFEEEFDVSVTEDFYDSNEAMQPVIAAGSSGFDVIVPSDYMVSILIEGGDIMALNKEAIPNITNLSSDFASGLGYDPDGTYSAPYQWGTTGLGVDKSVLGEDFPRTWGLVFDADLVEQYGTSGAISLLNDPRETMGAALKYLGYSLNTTSEEELAEATQLVDDTIDRLAAFDSDSYDENLATGQTALAHGYSGNFFAQFIDGTDDPEQYVYFVPEEGGTRWIDNMAIVADAPHPCTAHTFINFILDAENGAALSNWNYYASPNGASQDLIDPDVKPVLDLAADGVDPAKLELITDTGDFEVNFSDAFAEARG